MLKNTFLFKRIKTSKPFSHRPLKVQPTIIATAIMKTL